MTFVWDLAAIHFVQEKSPSVKCMEEHAARFLRERGDDARTQPECGWCPQKEGLIVRLGGLVRTNIGKGRLRVFAGGDNRVEAHLHATAHGRT